MSGARGSIDREDGGALSEDFAARVASNEAAYRKVNEGIKTGRRVQDNDQHPFLCECGNLGCNQIIGLRLSEYEAVRKNPRRFVVVNGHEYPEVETVVRRADRYAVVEKHPETAGIVERTNPRQ